MCVNEKEPQIHCMVKKDEIKKEKKSTANSVA